MSAKTILPSALILAALGTGAARSQAPTPPATPLTPMPATATPLTPMPPTGEPANKLPEPGEKAKANPALPNVLPPTPQPSQTAGWISPWIAYSRPDCCQWCGSDGPIESEYYWRTGISMPVATGILHDAVQAGWINEVGGRSLFFNKGGTAAWTVDLGLSYTYNNGNEGSVVFNQRVNFNDPLNGGFGQVDTPVSIRGYHRTSLNLSGGREWYLLQPVSCPGRHVRVGFDAGGRYGTSRVDLNDYGQLNNAAAAGVPPFIGFRHLTDVFGATFVSLHTDVEIPFYGCCVFTTGFRAEWNYNWSDAFSNEKGDLQDVNLMLQFGIRY
ncbi:MAG: hypothetical protein U0746_08960 [Gemmataceae bacterium]